MQFDDSDFTMSYINSMVSEYYFLDGDILTVTYSDGTTADYVYSSSDEKFISDDGSYIRDTLVDAYPYKYQSWTYGENKVAVEYYSAITYDTVTVVEASHIEGEAVIENNVDPTCTETGSYDTVVYCTVCGAELSRVTTTVEATGHSYVATETVDATCTEDGYIVYTCENDASHTYTEVLEALGHDYAIVETDATCTEAGYTIYTCTRCDDTYTTDGSTALGHDYVATETVDATCTEDGYIVYACSRCDDTYTEILEATGHTEGEAVIENYVDPTCTTAGSYDTVVYCAVCGAELSRVTVEVEATGHSFTNYVSNDDATCTQDGTKTAECDNGCGLMDTVTDEGTATGHTYEWVIADNNYPTKTCSVCGDVKVILAFTDISTETEYFDYIAYTSYYNSLITGVKANSTDTTTETFSPRTSLTRAMLVTILYRMAGSPFDDENPYTETPFSDVKAGVWYYNAVYWALDNGITTETKFKPNTAVTKEQTATFLYRYAGEYLGEDVSTDNDISSYPDASSVSAYAEEAMSWANAYGVITGTQQGYLNPQGTTLRVHATKILYGFGTAYSVGELEE